MTNKEIFMKNLREDALNGNYSAQRCVELIDLELAYLHEDEQSEDGEAGLISIQYKE